MKHLGFLWIFLLCGQQLLAQSVPLQSGKPPAETQKTEEPKTEITCKGQLNMDYSKNMAVFNDDVVVDDPRMRMTANKMTVYFAAETREIQKVVAEGNVKFKKENKSAKAEKAIYTAEDGKVVLTGNPMVKKDEDVMSGEKITFYRDDNRMLIEPRAKLILYSPPKGSKEEDWLK